MIEGHAVPPPVERNGNKKEVMTIKAGRASGGLSVKYTAEEKKKKPLKIKIPCKE